jgi:DNA-binding transcriptional LysR family regulator
MTVDLRHFRSFVAVAEQGKIGGAASRLFITQPALSRQMQELEREIGEQLFVRVPHGVELTEAGRELLPKARVAIEAADDALAVGDGGHPHGPLVLGIPLAGRRQRWFALTQAFLDRFPAVEVEMREALSEQLQRQVFERELDGALVLAPNRLEGLSYTHVVDERLAVWLHRSHPLAARSEMELADLHGQKVTLLGGPVGRSSGYNKAIRRLFADAGIEPLIEETLQVYPPSAGLEPDYLSVSVPVDYPAGVISVPLVPTATLPFEFVQREETNRAAIRAYARFAVEHLAAQACTEGMASPGSALDGPVARP